VRGDLPFGAEVASAATNYLMLGNSPFAEASPDFSSGTSTMFSLQGKITLVTGAGSGIGAAIARAFAQQGAVVYIGDRDEAAGESVAKEIRSAGGTATFLALDVSSADSCRAVANTIFAAHPEGLDVLMNNAGVGHVGTILQTEEADMDRLYAVNVKGVFFLSKIFLPAMEARRRGSIINLASIGGIVGVKDRLAYCTTKFAVVGLTKSMALDHAESQVRINCICPGRVETPFVQARIKEYPDPAKAYREMSATQALGRMGTPEEIAAAAVYLASDESAFVTGSSLIIDGGLSAGK
jgi:NAD(P)-dependent dehydrogenase (short-subunit alcohol dehydrogenase family)